MNSGSDDFSTSLVHNVSKLKICARLFFFLDLLSSSSFFSSSSKGVSICQFGGVGSIYDMVFGITRKPHQIEALSNNWFKLIVQNSLTN